NALRALQVLIGSAYVNDFEFLNRSYRVYVQAKGSARSTPSDLANIYVESQSGERIPFSTLIKTDRDTAPQLIKHFNLYRAAQIQGTPAEGYTSGEALAAIQEVLQELPRGFDYSFSGISLEQVNAGSTA